MIDETYLKKMLAARFCAFISKKGCTHLRRELYLPMLLLLLLFLLPQMERENAHTVLAVGAGCLGHAAMTRRKSLR